jgi:hypothetical protein
MQKHITVWATALLLFVSSVYAQKVEQDSTFRRYFIGSSAFILGNFATEYSPQFFQLNAGYWLTDKDVLMADFKTWRYFHPLGIPLGSSARSPEWEYPGLARGYGLGLAYQRFLWQGLYAAVEATSLLQEYKNRENELIQNGYQLFAALRVGYHIRLFDDRFFIEPSVACTAWPINTNVPKAFADLDSKWQGYFFEPGLHFGFKF